MGHFLFIGLQKYCRKRLLTPRCLTHRGELDSPVPYSYVHWVDWTNIFLSVDSTVSKTPLGVSTKFEKFSDILIKNENMLTYCSGACSGLVWWLNLNLVALSLKNKKNKKFCVWFFSHFSYDHFLTDSYPSFFLGSGSGWFRIPFKEPEVNAYLDESKICPYCVWTSLLANFQTSFVK